MHPLRRYSNVIAKSAVSITTFFWRNKHGSGGLSANLDPIFIKDRVVSLIDELVEAFLTTVIERFIKSVAPLNKVLEKYLRHNWWCITNVVSYPFADRFDSAPTESRLSLLR